MQINVRTGQIGPHFDPYGFTEVEVKTDAGASVSYYYDGLYGLRVKVNRETIFESRGDDKQSELKARLLFKRHAGIMPDDAEQRFYEQYERKYGMREIELPTPSCPAHLAIMREWSSGTDILVDPLPVECAKWLAKVTCGAASMRVRDDTAHQFGPGEGIDADGYIHEPGINLLRAVDTLPDDTYRLFGSESRDRICVVFVQRDPTGHAVWTRIDLQSTN